MKEVLVMRKGLSNGDDSNSIGSIDEERTQTEFVAIGGGPG